MQTEHIREFLMLASTMSFSRTAKNLYITQSALSRHIAAIEDELGAKLLIRDSHHVRLTDIGRSFLRDSELTISAYDNSLDHVKQLRQENKHVLRVGYIYDAGRAYLPRMTKALAQAVSDIAPRYRSLEYGELMNALMERKVDVAITMGIDGRSQDTVRWVCLDEDRYWAAVPKGHVLAREESVTLERLAREPLIFPDPKAMGPIVDFFARAIRANEFGITPCAYYVDIPSLIYQIEAGEGVSLVFSHHRKRYSDTVAFVPIEDLTESANIAIAWEAKSEELIPGSWAKAFERLASEERCGSDR